MTEVQKVFYKWLNRNLKGIKNEKTNGTIDFINRLDAKHFIC